MCAIGLFFFPDNSLWREAEIALITRGLRIEVFCLFKLSHLMLLEKYELLIANNHHGLITTHKCKALISCSTSSYYVFLHNLPEIDQSSFSMGNILFISLRLVRFVSNVLWKQSLQQGHIKLNIFLINLI